MSTANVVPFRRAPFVLPPGTLPQTTRQRQPERTPQFRPETAARVRGHLIAEATSSTGKPIPGPWEATARALVYASIILAPWAAVALIGLGAFVLIARLP